MTCVHPVYLKDKNLEVPCNHCLPCRIQKSREWSVRLISEYQYWQDSVFVTLTYDNDNLPADYGLHKRDVVLFLKRLRKKVPWKIKYFFSGEYGDKVGRPHYHGIIFGLKVLDRDLIHECWNKCQKDNVVVGTVTYDSCRYVCDYILKKYSGEKAKLEYYGREPPFQLFSKGIGRDYVFEHINEIFSELSVKQQGKEKGLPRYFANVIDRARQKDFRDQCRLGLTDAYEDFNSDFPDIKEKMRLDAMDSKLEEEEKRNENIRRGVLPNSDIDTIIRVERRIRESQFEHSTNRMAKGVL